VEMLGVLKYMCFAVTLTDGDYEAVLLPEDQELAGFVPLLSIAYTPVYVARGTPRVSRMSFKQQSQLFQQNSRV